MFIFVSFRINRWVQFYVKTLHIGVNATEALKGKQENFVRFVFLHVNILFRTITFTQTVNITQQKQWRNFFSGTRLIFRGSRTTMASTNHVLRNGHIQNIHYSVQHNNTEAL